MTKKRIAYVIGQDPGDRRTWSGIGFSCLEQLRRFYDVDIVLGRNTLIEGTIRLCIMVWRKLCFSHSLGNFISIVSKSKGRRISRILAKKKYDGIFLIGTDLGAYLKTDVPILYFSDATFNLMVGYYWPNASRISIREGDIMQKRCLENSTYCMFASKWALDDAVNYYGIPRDKCLIGKFGANVDTSSFAHAAPDDKTVNLLFVGVDWKRKGGDIAVECVRQLNDIDKSRCYILHLVGVKPPYKIEDSNIKVYGFLNRNIPEQQKLMISLREKADIFILPTQAECAGIVFCESSAYGIPSITYDTGGIGDYVVNGENGYRLPPGSSGKDFARVIADLLNTPGKLAYMGRRAQEMYSTELNWNHLGDTIHEVLK